MSHPGALQHRRGVPARPFRSTRYWARFRSIAGEKTAGFHHAQMLVERLAVRETGTTTIVKAIAIGQLRSWSLVDLTSDLVDLRRENQRLRQEVSSLRSLLLKTSRAVRTVPVAQQHDFDAVAELLTVIDEKEADLLLLLLLSGSAEVQRLVNALGTEKAMDLCNLLGKSQVAAVHNDQVVATEFGRSLGNWINQAASAD